MPHAARETFSEGIVHREAERIDTWLHDASKTAVNLVTTAEELPVSETLGAYHQLTEQLRLPLGVLFINRVREAPLSLSALSHIRPHTKTHDDKRLAEQVLDCAKAETALVEAQAIHFQSLRQLPLSYVSLPFCVSQEFGPAQLAELSHYIEAALGIQERNASAASHPYHDRKAKRST
jgi:hypothetical protein